MGGLPTDAKDAVTEDRGRRMEGARAIKDDASEQRIQGIMRVETAMKRSQEGVVAEPTTTNLTSASTTAEEDEAHRVRSDRKSLSRIVVGSRHGGRRRQRHRPTIGVKG